jgi:hypothetical protein
MNAEARIYRAEIIRALMGDRAHECKVADMHRLNQICEHLAECPSLGEADAAWSRQ